MDTVNLNTILFDGLITRLKAAGYNVSVEDVLNLHSLFLSFPITELALNELKYIITPLLVKTQEEQGEMYSIIDDYIAEQTGSPVEEISYTYVPPVTPPFKLPAEKQSIFKGEPELKIIVIVACGLLLAALAGLIYIRERNARYHVTSGIATTDTTLKDTSQKPLSANNNNAEKVVAMDTANNTGFAIQGLHSFEAREKNINMQLSVILGLIAGVVLSFIVFRVKANDYFTDDDSANKASFKSPGHNNSPPGESPGEENSGKDISLPAPIQFINNNNIITDDSSTVLIKKNMLKYRVGFALAFNIHQSILSAVKNAGFSSPVYKPKKEPAKYLVLLDEGNPDGHLFNLFSYFIDNLAAAGIYIERYTYTTNIFILADERKNSYSLKEIAYQKPEFHLLIFSDGKIIAGEDDLLSNSEIMESLASWQSRALITGVPVPDWGSTEKQFVKYGFTVVPAETEGIDLLMKAMSGSQTFSHKLMVKNLADIYSVREVSFANVTDIEKYLHDKQLFQLVCALAIHPRLNWSITVALYDVLVKSGTGNNGRGNDYNTLLKIARIPVFSTNTLGNAMRLSLLNRIERKTEAAARKAIHRILQQVKINMPNEPGALKELEEQRLLNEFFLFACDRKEFKNYASSKGKIVSLWRNLRDSVIKEHVASGNAKLMPGKTDGQHLNIEEFMVKEREREVTKVNFLRVLTTLIPGLLIYLFLVTFKPPFAYPKGSEIYGQNPVLLVLKKDSCSLPVETIKVSGNNLDTNFVVKADSTILYNMDYGVPVTLQYSYNGTEKSASIDCSDSLYIIRLVNCK